MNNNSIKNALDAWKHALGQPVVVSTSMADILAAAGCKEGEDFFRYRYLTKSAAKQEEKGRTR